MWALNSRIEEDVTETSCREETESIERNGQLVPAIGRAVTDDPAFDVEVICGLRRLYVARRLGIRLRLELRELTDRQAVVAVETENSLRRRISAYERGLWLAKLLRRGLYRTQQEMAGDLGVAPAQVTRLLKFAELPALVLGAFASPHDILESWALELHRAWHDERRRLLTERARALQKQLPRPPAICVYEALMASPNRAQVRRRGAARVVRGSCGEPLLRLEHQRKDVVVRIPNALVDVATELALTQAIVALLTQREPPARASAA